MISMEHDDRHGKKRGGLASYKWTDRLALVLLAVIAVFQVFSNSTPSMQELVGITKTTSMATAATGNKKYAIVHLLSSITPEYLMALLTSTDRLVTLHQLDDAVRLGAMESAVKPSHRKRQDHSATASSIWCAKEQMLKSSCACWIMDATCKP